MSLPTHSTTKIESSSTFLTAPPALGPRAFGHESLCNQDNHFRDSTHSFCANEKVTLAWEEPHPGQRLSLSASDRKALLAKSGIDGDEGSTGCRGDMAADIGALQHRRLAVGTSCVSRRISRGKRSKYNIAPRPLITCRDAVPRNGNNLNTTQITTGAVESSILPTTNRGEMDIAPSAYDADSDGSTIKEPSPSPPTSISQLQMTDFSGYAGTNTNTDEPEDVSAVIRCGKMSPIIVAAGDTYGWEAELDRRAPNPRIRHFSGHHYQQQSCGPKRGLLHRVFSFGHST